MSPYFINQGDFHSPNQTQFRLEFQKINGFLQLFARAAGVQYQKVILFQPVDNFNRILPKLSNFRILILLRLCRRSQSLGCRECYSSLPSLSSSSFSKTTPSGRSLVAGSLAAAGFKVVCVNSRNGRTRNKFNCVRNKHVRQALVRVLNSRFGIVGSNKHMRSKLLFAARCFR